MAVNIMDNDDCTRSSIANVLNEVNEFIDALGGSEEKHTRDGGEEVVVGGPPESDVPHSISMIDNHHQQHATTTAANDDRHNSFGACNDHHSDDGDADDNAIHESEELFSSLSTRYQMMMNLEKTRIENMKSSVDALNVRALNGGTDENQTVIDDADDDANKSSMNSNEKQLGYEICSGVRQKKYNGVEGESEIEKNILRLNIDRSDHNRNSCSKSIDNNIIADGSIGHSAGGSSSGKYSVTSCVENVPPSHRPKHQPQQQQHKPLFSSQNSTPSSDFQLAKNTNNTKRVDKKGSSTSPQRPSITTTPLSPSRLQSPFSSKSRQLLVRTNHDLVNDDVLLPITTDKGRNSFSLKNCRKVSLLLKVNPVMTEDAEDQILFPALMDSEEGGNNNFNDAAETDWADNTNNNTAKSQIMRHGEVILVNPKAFEVEGKGDNDKAGGGFGEKMSDQIAGRVTVETARLVAEVSRISSEDWARTYKFDDVYWSTGSNLHAFNSLSALASAAVEDVLSSSLRSKCDDCIPCSTIIFAFGGTETGKTQTIFGSSIAALTGTTNEKADNRHETGLLGDIMRGLLSSQHLSGHEVHKMPDNSSDPAIKCSISILEIVSEDVLRDVLDSSKDGLGAHGGSKTLRVRHSDNRGATVSNLRLATCESTDQLHELLHSSFKSQILRRAWNKEGGHGHFIVNINVSRPNGGCAKIQLVDLASSDRRAVNAAALRSVRKSLSSLRGVLRGVAMQHVNQDSASLKAPIPYRESTLTKLLQRSLDHQDGIGTWTRAVVVGTVRPSTKSYTQTLWTIDFMTRILAKAGETAHSPFRDGSSTSNEIRHSNTVDHDKSLDRIPPQNSATSSHPPTAALRSITSDPRQRLARLANSTPLIRDDAFSKVGTISGSAKSLKIRDSSYRGVLDQLDSLMDMDDNEINRKGYSEGLIDTLTPYKPKITSDESSSDSSDVPSPSPFRDSRSTKANDFEQQKYRLHDSIEAAKSHTAEEFFRSMPSESHEKSKLPVENRTSSVTSTISFESEPERLSLFPKVSAINPLSIILPLDSMDSEEHLVSSRGQDIFFGDSVLRQKNNSVFHLAKNSPTYESFESFKQEIDTLVASFTPRRARNESDNTQMVDIPDGPSEDTKARGLFNADPKYMVLEAEVTSLSAKVQSLAREKSALESFLTTIQSIMMEKNVKEAGRLGTQKINEIMCTITDRLSLLVNLEPQLESSKAECVKLSSELSQAGKNTSLLSLAVKNIERELIKARGENRFNAKATALLESQNAQLIKQLEDMRDEQTASAVFFNRLDDLLGIRNHDLSGKDEGRNQLRFECIENLKAEIQHTLNRLKDSTEREQQARNNIEQLNSQIHELKIREKELRESISRSEANRIDTEKIAEEAISANENVNNQLTDLRSELVKTQKAYEILSSSHNVALCESQTLRNEYEMVRSDAIKHEREILRLNGELAARHEDESQRDIASFKAKTIAVMKQHMEGLKVDYATRIEDFKSSYAAEKESDTVNLLQLDLSNRKGENEILKRRIKELEKLTSSELQNAEKNLNRIQGELIWARDDASKQRELNNKMQGELDHLHSLMDIAEESVSELNRLKKENSKLNESLSTQNEQDSRVSIADEDPLMHERISTLMRENEQNNISMRTLQAENASLKSSIEQCTSTIQLMYSEMSDLKSITMDGISKLKTKEKSLLEEQQKSRRVIAEMENKLENANNLVRMLQSSTDRSFTPNALPNVFDRPKTPFVHRSSVEYYHTLPAPGSSSVVDRQSAAELSTEKELRCKAEEICAGVLVNSKAALEERDNEINRLRTQLFRISSKR